MKELIKYIYYPFAFVIGFISYILTKKTPKQSYAAMRYLFVKSDGKLNDLISKVISIFIKQYSFQKSEGILGDLSNTDVNRIVSNIEQNGYFEFKAKLDQAIVDNIYQFASNTSSRVLDLTSKNTIYSNEKVIFDENNIVSPRYQYDSAQLFKNEEIVKIVCDQNLLHIANNYLKTKPILDIVTMWWSLPFESKGLSQAAQMYHFDMDRFKFLKFFFYLTDVTLDNGPHCYIAKTNSRIPNKIRKDGRVKDEDILSFYNQNQIMEFVGKAGSILAVDTRGLHKGKPLVIGKRLLFQIQFSNLLFGAEYPLFSASSPELNAKKNKFRRTFSLFK